MSAIASHTATETYCFGPFRVDVQKQTLLRGGEPIALTPKAFQLLVALLRHHSEIVTKDELMKTVWPDTFVEETNLTRNIFALRKALGETDQNRYIVTVPGQGYRLAEDVHLVTESGIAAGAARNKSVFFRGKRWVATIGAVALGSSIVLLVARPWQTKSPLLRFSAFTNTRGVARKPAFSPDGHEIAFSWSRQDSPFRIYVQAVGSSTARKLVEDSEPSHEELVPRWWPDGSRIAYIRSVPNKPDEIWTVPRTGGVPRKLLTLAQVLGFDIAPDGKNLVVGESPGPPNPFSIYLISLDDMSRRPLTTAPATMSALAGWQTGDVDPRFSPDGRNVAFVRWTSAGSDIYEVRLGGDSIRRLTENNALIDGFAWANEQALILATAHGERYSATLELWRFSLPARRWEPLTATSLRSTANADPAVSPDGRSVAATQRSNRIDLYRYDLRAPGQLAEPMNLADTSACNMSPAFSPDGTKLAYGSCRSGHWEIYVANRDGSNPVQLTSFGGRTAGSPQWSPDGAQITFDFRPNQHAHIFVIDSNGGPPKQLTFGDTDNMLPKYSADGNWIYFARRKPGGSDLWKVSRAGGDPVFVMPDVWTFALQDSTVYYTKLFQRGIYARSLGPGTERLIIGESGAFTVLREGIYYLHEPASGPLYAGVSTTVSVNGPPLMSRRGCQGRELRFYSLADHTSTHVLEVRLPVCHGMDVSSDRSTVFVSGTDPVQSDIILSQDFK